MRTGQIAIKDGDKGGSRVSCAVAFSGCRTAKDVSTTSNYDIRWRGDTNWTIKIFTIL